MKTTAHVTIANGRVVDPLLGKEEVKDIRMADGKITGEKATKHLKVFDATGLIVMPGWIDMHVHCREPGFTHKEDLASASKAAIRGGIPTIVAMPNTKPVIDNPSAVDFVMRKAENLEVNLLQASAITIGLAGEKLVDFMAMKNAGAVLFTDDHNPVQNSRVMKKALLESVKNKILIAQHCEDNNAKNGGVCVSNAMAKKLGLKSGFSREVELNCVERDLKLVEETKGREHFMHLSLKESVEALAKAKKKGLAVSAEATPHHFSLTEETVLERGTNAKMNPPLRSEKDVRAIRDGLKNGAIDVISTDHAPHSVQEKAESWEKAPNGTVGLETSLALCITNLIETKTLSWLQLAQKTSLNPARLLGLESKGSLKPGFDADVTIIDPEFEWIVDSALFASKSRNSAFDGMELKGKAVAVVAKGVLYDLR
ncbi:TPA: dihydroorotase [Candidatus Micrarchaeota archaeon]|nr:dihydroorotase [Candidatus Micrarchaeota archaeon]